MHRFDQGWRELNPVEKVETAMDFFLTFAGIMLIVALAVVGGVLLYEHTTQKVEHAGRPEIVCGQVGPMTLYC